MKIEARKIARRLNSRTAQLVLHGLMQVGSERGLHRQFRTLHADPVQQRHTTATKANGMFCKTPNDALAIDPHPVRGLGPHNWHTGLFRQLENLRTRQSVQAHQTAKPPAAQVLGQIVRQ